MKDDAKAMSSARMQTRELIYKILKTDSALNAFLLDYFTDVWRQISDGMSRDTKISLLLAHHSVRQVLDYLEEQDHSIPTDIRTQFQTKELDYIPKSTEGHAATKKRARLRDLGLLAFGALLWEKLCSIFRTLLNFLRTSSTWKYLTGSLGLLFISIGAWLICHKQIQPEKTPQTYINEQNTISLPNTNAVGIEYGIPTENQMGVVNIRKTDSQNPILDLATKPDFSTSVNRKVTKKILAHHDSETTSHEQMKEPDHPMSEGLDMDGVYIAPDAADSPMENQKLPRIIPEGWLQADLLNGKTPYLSNKTTLKYPCQELTGTYKICLDVNGEISEVHILNGIPDSDDEIISGVKKWKYKAQKFPVCFTKQFLYFIEGPNGCNTKSDAKDLIKIERMGSNDNPTISEKSIEKLKGEVIRYSYQICIGIDGFVTEVTPIRSIDKNYSVKGEDKTMMKGFKKWTFRPLAAPTCVLEEGTLHIPLFKMNK